MNCLPDPHLNQNKKFRMKKTIGFVLVAVGIIMIAFTSFNYVTTEKVVDLGPVQINQEKNHPVKWSPIVGAVLLVGGIVVLVLSKKNNK